MARLYFCDGIYKTVEITAGFRSLQIQNPLQGFRSLQVEDRSSGRDETRFGSYLTFPHLFPRLLSLEQECVTLASRVEPSAAARLAKMYLQAWQLLSAAKRNGEQLSFP